MSLSHTTNKYQHSGKNIDFPHSRERVQHIFSGVTQNVAVFGLRRQDRDTGARCGYPTAGDGKQKIKVSNLPKNLASKIKP